MNERISAIKSYSYSDVSKRPKRNKKFYLETGLPGHVAAIMMLMMIMMMMKVALVQDESTSKSQ